MKDPSVDIPIGIVGATSIACVLYMALALVLCAMVPAAQMDPAAPFASAFAMLAPAGGAWRAAFLHTSARFVSFGAFTGVQMTFPPVSPLSYFAWMMSFLSQYTLILICGIYLMRWLPIHAELSTLAGAYRKAGLDWWS